MIAVYTILGVGWAWLCYKNLQDLLPIQVCHVLRKHNQLSPEIATALYL